MMNKLLNTVLSERINTLINSNEYGVSLVNIPIFDLGELCNSIESEKIIEVFIIGSTDEFAPLIRDISRTNITFSYSIEATEQSRNSGREDVFRIIIIRRNDIQKMTSLEWFNKITMDTIYKLCCDYVKKNLVSNTFINEFVKALGKSDLKRLLNFEEVIEFLNKLYLCDNTQLQSFIDDHLFELLLCSDKHLSEFSTADNIKNRLKENKKIINKIIDLDKVERQNLNNYSIQNPTNQTPKNILNFYKTKDRNTLKLVDYDDAIACLSAKREGSGPRRENSPKISPTAFAAKLIFDNKDDKIDAYLNEIKAKFDIEKPDGQCTLDYNNQCSTTLKYDVDSFIITNEFVDEDKFGAIYYFDSDSPSDAISKCKRHTPYNLDIKYVKEKIYVYLDRYIAQNIETSIKENLEDFILKRKSVVKYKNRLKDFAMLEVIAHFNDFSNYLKSYERLLSSIDSDYLNLTTADTETAKDITSYIMSLDFVYFISKTNNCNTYAIPTVLNPLYLWKYIKLAEEILDSRNISDPSELAYLSEKDKEFIIRKSEDLPNPLSLFFVPSVITEDAPCFLTLNGNIGVIPVYCQKQLIDDSYTNEKDIENIIKKYLFLYPHALFNLKLAFINPPSVDAIAKVINSFDNSKEFDEEISFDVTVLKTNDSNMNWVTIDDDTLNSGIFSKIKSNHRKQLEFKVYDKVISYEDACEIIGNNVHLLFVFDPNEKKMELSANSRNIHIHPLCVPKVYEYNPIQKKKRVSCADSESVFNLYAKNIERIKEQPAAGVRHTRVFTVSPLREDTYKRMLNLSDWVVIFDRNLKTWDIALNSSSEKLCFSESDSRSYGVYSLNSDKLSKGYRSRILALGNYIPDAEGKGIENIIETIRLINNDGLLSIISQKSNNIIDNNQGKGSLGLAIACILYKKKYPDSIIVGLDTQLAREWLSNRDKTVLPDLVAIRSVAENNFIIDIIEVKSYREYTINGDTIDGHSVEQVSSLGLLSEMFSRSEKITTVARREILREQVFDYIFNAIEPNTLDSESRKISELIKNINSLFSGNCNPKINKNIAHIEFGTITNSVKAYHDVNDYNNLILLNVIGKDFIQKIVFNSSISPSEIPFFELENSGFDSHIHVDDNNNLVGSAGIEQDEFTNVDNIEEEIGNTNDQIETYETVSQSSSDQKNISSLEMEDVIENCRNLYTILKDYGIRVKPIDSNLVQVTSRFYRFKIELFNGESISKIERFKEDISRGLEAQGPIMISNVPGTKYVAIDVCYNMNPQPLSLLDNLSKLDESHGKLDILGGESVDGKFEIIDLAEAVHMLIAGTTGSGKTLFLYSMICSLLYKHTADELDLIMVDPKQTDFVFFSNLKCCHDNKIIYDPNEAIDIIKWINDDEKNRRTNLLRSCSARDINSYNLKNPNNKMKRIVLIIDEYADLVRTADSIGKRKEFEATLCQLAQRVRNIGIHIVLATQWPSASIVTSALKANIPYRISFKVPQHQDSQIILDRTGAEDLLGKGDMLILNNGNLLRLQSCYIDADTELVDFLKKYE